MKSLTRVGLPILVVVVAVFGITFVRMYSTEEPDPATLAPKPTRPTGAATAQPIRFNLTTATPITGKPEPWEVPLTYWNPEVEVGSPGHFEFWGQNPNPDPVTVRVFDVNCQCAGVEMAPVPQAALRDYAAVSALAGGPLGLNGPLAAVAHAQLAGRLKWEMLLDNDNGEEKFDRVVPAASPATGPQVAVFRLGWKPKEDAGPKMVAARIAGSVGDNPPRLYALSVNALTVPAFEVGRRVKDGWESVREVPFGELRANGQGRQTLYLISTTRRYPLYRLTTDTPDPCVTWTDPAPASADEVRSLAEYFARPGRPLRRALSVSRVEITVKERTGGDGPAPAHRLDLGVFSRHLTVTAADGGSAFLRLTGRVLGDVRFLTGAADGRIDLGGAFSADRDHTVDAVLVAETDGLDLRVVEAETSPGDLTVKLEPLEKLEGRNQWRLRVTVPKRSLVGSLPPQSAIVLTTTGPNPRRLRIPVQGTTYDSGGPRL